jgi:hypothetical protein
MVSMVRQTAYKIEIHSLYQNYLPSVPPVHFSQKEELNSYYYESGRKNQSTLNHFNGIWFASHSENREEHFTRKSAMPSTASGANEVPFLRIKGSAINALLFITIRFCVQIIWRHENYRRTATATNTKDMKSISWEVTLCQTAPYGFIGY